jgi:hypothetical protein
LRLSFLEEKAQHRPFSIAAAVESGLAISFSPHINFEGIPAI